MSLTTVLKIPAVSKIFEENIKFPELPYLGTQVERRVDPKKAGLLGTALDYAVRFWLQKKYNAKHHGKLIAQLALDTRAEMERTQRTTIMNVLASAEKGIEKSKQADSSFAYYCIQLANLDFIYRNGRLPEQLPYAPDDDMIAELRQLLHLAVRNWPVPEQPPLLNPTFGKGSVLVGGADADVIQDGCILDMKCVKRPELKEPIKQVIGYYVLSRIGGVNGASEGFKPIDSVGVYFARHAALLRYQISDLVTQNNVAALIDCLMTVSEYLRAGSEPIESPHFQEPGNEWWTDAHGDDSYPF